MGFVPLIFFSVCLVLLYVFYHSKMAGFLFSLACFFILCFLFRPDDFQWFDYAKRFTVIIPMLFYTLGMKLDEMKVWPKLTRVVVCAMPFILVLNIFEAILQDFLTAHFFNCLIGVVVVATIPRFWGKWSYDSANVLGFGNFWDWSILYTVWNGYFIQTHVNSLMEEMYGLGLLSLLIAIIASLVYGNWHIWVFGRAFSLQMALVALIIFPNEFPSVGWNIPDVAMQLWALVNGLSALFVIYRTINERRSCLVYLGQEFLPKS